MYVNDFCFKNSRVHSLINPKRETLRHALTDKDNSCNMGKNLFILKLP